MARMQSGAEFSQFDQMTTKEGKERIMKLEEGYSVIIKNYIPREEFERYKKATAEATEKNNTAILGELESAENVICGIQEDCQYWYQLWYVFFCSKFFRFMNFFGRWFIYAEDGKIYPNTPEWKDKRPMNWIQRILFRLHIRKILTKIQKGSEESCEHLKPDNESETGVSDSTNL